MTCENQFYLYGNCHLSSCLSISYIYFYIIFFDDKDKGKRRRNARAIGVTLGQEMCKYVSWRERDVKRCALPDDTIVSLAFQASWLVVAEPTGLESTAHSDNGEHYCWDS